MILRAFLLSRWGLCMFLLLEVRVLACWVSGFPRKDPGLCSWSCSGVRMRILSLSLSLSLSLVLIPISLAVGEGSSA